MSTRRGLLGGAAAAGMTMTCGAGSSPANPDAELIAACAEFDALTVAFGKTDFDAEPSSLADRLAEAEQDRIGKAQKALLRRIFDLPATTLEGHQARGRSLALFTPDRRVPDPSRDCFDVSLAFAITRDLAQGARA